MKRCIRLNENDDLATLLEPGMKGDLFSIIDYSQSVVGEIVLLEDIPYPQKVAIRPIAKGEKVIKLGEPIGRATSDIIPGTLAHVNNIASIEGARGMKGSDCT